MKILKNLITSLVMFVFGLTTSAQTHNPGMNMKMDNTKTETFKVWGNCAKSCKTRIEKAVREEGATSAEWNLKTQLLAVTYDPAKTSVDAMSEKLASVGHDTEKYKSDDKVYNSLDACCKYPRVKQE